MAISIAGQARFITQIVAFVVIEANMDGFIYVFMRVLPKGENAPFFASPLWLGASLRSKIFVLRREETLFSPNEDFGRPNQPFRMRFPAESLEALFNVS